jgi:hypothetical protein
LRILHRTEFVWLVAEDENRAEDGLELRGDFLRETRLDTEPEWEMVPCSIFEMLLAFTRRAEFQTTISTKDWFWIMIANLELGEYRRIMADDVPVIDDILYKFVWRLYNDAGHGGLFPLRWPKSDQREIEIWYQFCEYVDEQDLV